MKPPRELRICEVCNLDGIHTRSVEILTVVGQEVEVCGDCRKSHFAALHRNRQSPLIGFLLFINNQPTGRLDTWKRSETNYLDSCTFPDSEVELEETDSSEDDDDLFKRQ